MARSGIGAAIGSRLNSIPKIQPPDATRSPKLKPEHEVSVAEAGSDRLNCADQVTAAAETRMPAVDASGFGALAK